MSPRLKAYLLGAGLLGLAAAFGIRAVGKYERGDSTVGVVLSGIVAVGFAFGGLRYVIRGRPETPSTPQQTTEPPTGGAT